MSAVDTISQEYGYPPGDVVYFIVYHFACAQKNISSTEHACHDPSPVEYLLLL